MGSDDVPMPHASEESLCGTAVALFAARNLLDEVDDAT
jgi:hypothetical protein